MLKHLLIAGLLAGTVIIPNTQPGEIIIMPNGGIIQDTGPTINTPDGTYIRVPSSSSDDFQKRYEDTMKSLENLKSKD